jgi:hypothetical protein
MKGNPVQDTGPSEKKIEISIDPRLENDRFEDFVNNYLVPFLQQLQVPVLKINIDE